ncbi:MAG: DedA family protein [Burkholderiales bacterium]
MEFLLSLVDLVLHLDKHLAALLQQYGTMIYVLLFIIVFCETGLVVTPFLPGDSLLFVSGALWAAGGLDVHALMATLIGAALLGDNCNYWIGRFIGPRVFRWENSRFFNRKALDYTHAFYERHGGKTLIIARFLPLVRTFAPFVAGVGHMRYSRFIAFSVVGALVWVVSLVYAGYFLGNIPVVKQNLSVVILSIIAISLLPLLIQYLRSRTRRA